MLLFSMVYLGRERERDMPYIQERHAVGTPCAFNFCRSLPHIRQIHALSKSAQMSTGWQFLKRTGTSVFHIPMSHFGPPTFPSKKKKKRTQPPGCGESSAGRLMARPWAWHPPGSAGRARAPLGSWFWAWLRITKGKTILNDSKMMFQLLKKGAKWNLAQGTEQGCCPKRKPSMSCCEMV